VSAAAGRWGRSLGWVLRAYPKGTRRDELLGTLREAGTRPGPRIFLNLVRHGLRARLGRPGSRVVVVVAVLVALTTGLGFAAVASRIAWSGVRDYPSGDRLAGITGTLFPGVAIEGGRSATGLFFDYSEHSTLLHGHNEDFEFATYDFAPSGQNVAAPYRTWTDAAAARLTADGWDVRDVWPTGATVIATGKLDEDGRAFWATRDGLSLEFSASTNVVGTPPGSFYAEAHLGRLAPRWVTVVGGAGWLVGVLFGWFLTGYVSRRTEWASDAARLASHAAAGIGLVLLLPATLMGTLGLIAEPLRADRIYQPFWWLSVTWGYGCTVFGVLLGLIAIGAATVAGTRENRARAAEEPRAGA